MPYLSLDVLKMGLTRGVPEYEIDPDAGGMRVAERLWPLVHEMSYSLLRDRVDYVMEGEIVPAPVAALQLEEPSQVKACFLGYTTIAPEQKLRDIRMHGGHPNDWTTSYDDRALLKIISREIAFSRYLRDECARSSMPYFDTSDHFAETLDQVVKYVREISLFRISEVRMSESPRTPAGDPPVLRVAAGEDQFGEPRGLGISTIDFKVTAQDSRGLFVLENTFHARGGPARHLHYDQDEWFYALEGEFIIEIGSERIRLTPGDSLLAPRKVPHVWAYVGDARGRILIAFMPAGKMEAFFREVTKANAMPPQDPELWRAHGMELLGPPLAIS